MARACILGKHVVPMGSQGVRAGTDNRASTPKPVSGGNILFGSEMIPSGYDLNFYMNTPSGMTSFPMGPPNLLLVINLIYISTPSEV